MRFLCTGDLHLGAGVRGVPAAERLAEQENVWQQIVAVAESAEVDAILFAGDAFEGPLPAPEHYRAWRRGVEQSHCEIFAITGNGRHDAAMRDASALDAVRDVNLTVCSGASVWRSSRSGVQVAALPWVPVSRLVAAQDGEDRSGVYETAAELLVRAAADLRAEITGPAVLLLHWSISGTTLPNGLLTDALREVVLPREDLLALGFNAIVAGHIHRPQTFGERAFYVGSPMPLNFGEGGGTQHGCWILDLDAEMQEFVPLDSPGFVTVDIPPPDADGGGGIGEYDFRGDDYAGAYVKIRYQTTEAEAREIDQDWVRSSLLAAGARAIFFELTILRTARTRASGFDETLSATDAFRLWLDGQDVDDAERPALAELHAEYVAGAAA